MFRTLNRQKAQRLAKALPPMIKPIHLRWFGGNRPAEVHYSDGQYDLGSCIRCHDAPCIRYSPNELALPVFNDFPADQNANVCPTSAILWPENIAAPTVAARDCITCGLCAARCPVGAIFLNTNGAHVNDYPNPHLILQEGPADEATTKSTANLFRAAATTGIYLQETDNFLAIFRSKFEDVSRHQSAQFPNHLARNLLIAVGIGAAMRRRGDVYLRMDLLLGPPGVQKGTAEVEFGAEVLEAPRDILDDIAVLVARYELAADFIVPLIVCLDLPNLRSEYWQFIHDVRQVLKIKINSITLGALAILVWNRARIKITAGDELYVDAEIPSLRPKIETILGRILAIDGDGYPGFLASGK